MEAVKTCKDCGQTKPRTAFYRCWGKNKSSGSRDSRCAPCSNKRREQRRKNSPASAEAHKRAKRIRYFKNRVPPPPMPSVLSLEERQNIRLDKYLRRKFNITLVEFKVLEAQQNGVCKICGRPPCGGRKRLSVDHCHATGRVRGLLCHPCNVALGHFRDSVTTLNSAITYLESNSLCQK